MIPSVATVAVSMIYCLWDAYRRVSPLPRRQQLRERVAYMLWVMAGQLD
jgi:hypothetical protein